MTPILHSCIMSSVAFVKSGKITLMMSVLQMGFLESEGHGRMPSRDGLTKDANIRAFIHFFLTWCVCCTVVSTFVSCFQSCLFSLFNVVLSLCVCFHCEGTAGQKLQANFGTIHQIVVLFNVVHGLLQINGINNCVALWEVWDPLFLELDPN